MLSQMMHKSWWAHPQFELDLKGNCVGPGHMLVGLVHRFLLIIVKISFQNSTGNIEPIQMNYHMCPFPT